jgi:hypothetical protein
VLGHPQPPVPRGTDWTAGHAVVVLLLMPRQNGSRSKLLKPFPCVMPPRYRVLVCATEKFLPAH